MCSALVCVLFTWRLYLLEPCFGSFEPESSECCWWQEVSTFRILWFCFDCIQAADIDLNHRPQWNAINVVGRWSGSVVWHQQGSTRVEYLSSCQCCLELRWCLHVWPCVFAMYIFHLLSLWQLHRLTTFLFSGKEFPTDSTPRCYVERWWASGKMPRL